MILDMNGRITTTAHLICFANEKKDKFLSTHPKFGWTENFNFARCYKEIEEALEFLNLPVVQSIIGNEKVLLVWTDNKEIIYIERVQ